MSGNAPPGTEVPGDDEMLVPGVEDTEEVVETPDQPGTPLVAAPELEPATLTPDGPPEGPAGEPPAELPAEPPSPAPRRQRVVRRALTALGVLLLVVIVAAAAIVGYARFKLGRHKTVSCGACEATDSTSVPMNVLVLGSDSRAGMTPQELQQYDPTGQDRKSGQRADTIAVLHIDFKASKAILISLPRDLRVKAPDGSFVKINSFYNQGPTAMVQAVESFTGLNIDHYVEVNFVGFRHIVDTLGGVRIRFSRKVVDPNSGLNVPAGCDLLHGDQALAFVRVREIDSDYGRIARQQFFVELVMKQVLSAGTLVNPLKVISLINTGAANVTTDTGLGAGTIEKLALRLRNFSQGSVDFRVVPSQPQYIGGIAYVIPFVGQSAALFDAVKKGTPPPDYGKQGSAISPSSVAATILNGTTKPGLESQAQQTLQTEGYHVIATGPAPATTATSTVVYYTPGNVDKASLLSQAFGDAPVEPLPPQIQTQIKPGADAVVVLGPDYAQGKVAPVPSASPTAAPSPAASAPAAASPATKGSPTTPSDQPAGPATALPTSSLVVSPC